MAKKKNEANKLDFAKAKSMTIKSTEKTENKKEVSKPSISKEAKADEKTKRGVRRRIPKNWEKKIIRLDPALKERLLTVVLTAKLQKNEAYDLQDSVINNALAEYLTKVEKKLNIK